ncbi:hypothetical protein VOLCADRAFT_107333 [Volvox carteri f. nagariensis]|uniref:Uncharacterized protein n=1 Tax=Volvox carteri f. nagariensis TaxID=3068 RepID=D8UDC8_VOLCA|nr:uncharacterized protein VOLCADRAFT_107333 [Volvox carteri f. nagariensis]EFJ42287.1 hypothetical protein VOLCADRAFT_107333 [Volvox carteri f. nagariensis]|eukprot:XP_002956685.1 hypothetical protein VOLCADRAFT_107333 [Volvox carteri f. nagariensis]
MVSDAKEVFTPGSVEVYDRTGIRLLVFPGAWALGDGLFAVGASPPTYVVLKSLI